MTPHRPSFSVDPAKAPIELTPRDGVRLVHVLRRARTPAATRSAAKIERATQLAGSSAVQLSLEEDAAVVDALRELRRSGDLATPLQQLEYELRQKLAAQRS